jgi:hypothetical protein
MQPVSETEYSLPTNAEAKTTRVYLPIGPAPSWLKLKDNFVLTNSCMQRPYLVDDIHNKATKYNR